MLPEAAEVDPVLVVVATVVPAEVPTADPEVAAGAPDAAEPLTDPTVLPLVVPEANVVEPAADAVVLVELPGEAM